MGIINNDNEAVKRLVLLGGGGHCLSVLDCALRSRKFDEIAILDPGVQVGSIIMGCPVLGGDEQLPTLFEKEYRYAFISIGTIGDTTIRHALADKAGKIGFRFPNIIDPSAVVSEHATLGEGIFVGKNSVINAGCVVRDMAIINTGSIVEHNTVVGEYGNVSVGCIVCGDCVVGDDAFIGAGTTIVNGIHISDGVFVKAASLVKGNL